MGSIDRSESGLNIAKSLPVSYIAFLTYGEGLGMKKTLLKIFGYFVIFLVIYGLSSVMKENPFVLSLAVVLTWYNIDKLQGEMKFRAEEEIRIEGYVKAIEEKGLSKLEDKIDRLESDIYRLENRLTDKNI